ncbi:MAG: TRAP transporter small permease [bacterium]
MLPITIVIAILIALYFALERARPGLLHQIEAAIVAILLAAMTLVSFIQVIARYGFSSGWGGALEFTRILFAWLIIFGMSYGIRINAHLGVDALVRLLPQRAFRAMAIVSALSCVLYAAVFLYANWLDVFGAPAKGGAMDYWAKMYRAGVGLEDLRFPEWAQQAFGLKDRVPRWVAYLILPVGLALFAFRCLEATIAIWKGDREMIIASHEAEELIAKNRAVIEE